MFVVWFGSLADGEPRQGGSSTSSTRALSARSLPLSVPSKHWRVHSESRRAWRDSACSHPTTARGCSRSLPRSAERRARTGDATGAAREALQQSRDVPSGVTTLRPERPLLLTARRLRVLGCGLKLLSGSHCLRFGPVLSLQECI